MCREVKLKVEPGRLVEVPTPDATGVDRRAFGEFESARGELASYALGWTTGADLHVGQVFQQKEPALFVVNDADDELWQLIGKTRVGPDSELGHRYHSVDEDPTLMDVLDLDPGHTAVREKVGGRWKRQVEPPES